MFILKRIISNGNGTFGALLKNDDLFCMTLEPSIIKLPPGLYKCERYLSPKRGFEVYKIDFPQSDKKPLEIHPGNTIQDTEGCILVGGFDPFYKLNDLPGVNNSRKIFEKLMSIPIDCFWLKVE